MQTFFLAKAQATRDRFASLRNELSRQIAKLSNAELEDIATKLDELSDDLEAGMEEPYEHARSIGEDRDHSQRDF